MSDVQLALDKITAKLKTQQTFVDYYKGNHKLAFATEKFKTAFGKTLVGMRDNLCPIVVDAAADRMEVINFAGEKETELDAEGNEIKDPLAVNAWALWQRELMEFESFNVHVEAIKAGTAYLIVWPSEEGSAKFYLQDSRNCALIRDEDTDVPLFGAKLWETEDEKLRLTLYYSDRLERYQTPKKKPVGMELKEKHFVRITEEGETANPYGIIPMFEFETNPVLSDAIPIQDALNKTIADALVAAEFMAYPQRYVTGIDPPIDEVTGKQSELFKAGADRVWWMSDPKGKFGQFDAADLEAYIKVADSYRLEMARVSGTPLHFFSINTSDAISGKALKALESRFTKRVKRLTLSFGAVWSRAMKLALTIERQNLEGSLTAQWAPVETQDESEQLDNAIKKNTLGIAKETIWEELGYTKEDTAKFTAAEEQKAKEQMEMMKAQPAFAGK